MYTRSLLIFKTILFFYESRVKKIDDETAQKTSFHPVSSIPNSSTHISNDQLEINTQQLKITNPKPNPRNSNLYSYIAFHHKSNKAQ